MLEAVVFDMDGIIADTQRYHSQAESILLSTLGINLSPEEITLRFAGVDDRAQFKELFQLYKINLTVEEAVLEKWRLMSSQVEADGIIPIRGAVELVNLFHQESYPLAVASGSPLHFIGQVLSSLQIREKFNFLNSGEEVENGKPDPAVFILAAHRLNVDPRNCLVIEDGLSGMIAARSAGMKCIGLVPSELQSSREYPVDMLVVSLEEVTLEKITPLFNS